MMLCPPGVVWVVDLRAELTSHGPSQGDLHIIPQETPSQSIQRCGGCPRAVLPPPSATHQCNRWALCRDIFGFCHCSRSTPLIAMNYFGINGDVLRTSTINEASRMSAPANISWWREMGKYMVVEEEEGWENIEGGGGGKRAGGNTVCTWGSQHGGVTVGVVYGLCSSSPTPVPMGWGRSGRRWGFHAANSAPPPADAVGCGNGVERWGVGTEELLPALILGPLNISVGTVQSLGVFPQAPFSPPG